MNRLPGHPDQSSSALPPTSTISASTVPATSASSVPSKVPSSVLGSVAPSVSASHPVPSVDSPSSAGTSVSHPAPSGSRSTLPSSPSNPSVLPNPSNSAANPSATTNPSTPTGTSKVIDITAKIKGSNSTTPSILSYETKPLPNKPYNDTHGYEHSLLVDPTASFMIISCSNGNLYPLSVESPDNPACSELWATYDDILVADGAERLAHYYNNTMSVLGVSRLRVEDETDIPAGGVVVGFAPYADDGSYEDGSYMYMAVDPYGDVFYLMVCDYEDATLGSKIFLAKDPEEGVETLKSEDVMYTVTGGKVKDCFPLVLVQGTYDDSDSYLGYSEAQDSADWDLEEGWYEEDEL